MTFVLKDFNYLVDGFKQAVEVILIRESKNPKIKTITDLPEPRKSQLQFLQSVITELQARIQIQKDKLPAKDKHKEIDTKPFALILYGAMDMISHEVENKVGMFSSVENSQLYTSLTETMYGTDGSSKKGTPDANQVKAMYDALHSFLQLIYKEQNSRKGLAENHILSYLPTARLQKLLELTFKLSEKASNNCITMLKAEGKTAAEPDKYRVATPVTADVVGQFKTWDALRAALTALILKERSDKNVSNPDKLKSTNRAAQLNFLMSLEAYLDKIDKSNLPNAEKVAILAGAMYIVRGQINAEYGRNAILIDDIPAGLLQNGSLIHTGLSEILDAKNESFADVETMVAAAVRFIKFCTIEEADGKDIKNDSFRSAHIFSKEPVWDLKAGLVLAHDMIKTCREGALHMCLNPAKEATKAEGAAKGGFFSKLLPSSEKATPAAVAAAATSAPTPSPQPGSTGH